MKKGSLNLSVNAIVVLILAVVMLGLGLGFTKGMFAKVSTSLEEQVSTEQDPATPGPSSPLTVSRGRIISEPGETHVLKASLYNPTASTFSNAQPTLDCGTGITLSVNSNQRNVEPATFETFGILVDIPKNTADGTHLCTVKDAGTAFTYQEDLALTIK